MLELKKTPEHTIDRVFLLALLALFARNVVYSLLAAVVVFFFGALFSPSEQNSIIRLQTA